MKIFENFTNKFELQKTLKFELKPIGNTENLIKENHILELDKAKKQNYERVKPYFNKIHSEFINFCLKNTDFDFSELFESYKKFQKDKKNKEIKNEKEKIEKKFLEKVGNLFENNVKNFLESKNML